ncbi:dihydroxyacetone kinase-like protein [Peptoniphilus koenoeneniae]|uniref:Dihydroxyacetone kinase-like protein n=1 Tax=Peptoniphilus koenoeneniae TaxID=507751 RepID=A0ABU0ASY0_9FIRM|nr:dihydroxyacetone kinase subunit DhaL [Peptoniphilus koenoeneniae]MDQ0274378.1 dihydroxyacetone kinase-like protein [Peptoniphilus koenoeneniae]
MKINTIDYLKYIENVYEKLQNNREYVTNLDLATGDGDHWNNMNIGFGDLLKNSEKYKDLPMDQLFKNIGMTMMSKIGGSSGVLYGGAYLAAAKTLKGKEEFDLEDIYLALKTMVEDMKKRGKTEVGSKTMIDALNPAVEELEKHLNSKEEDLVKIFENVKNAAINGAESTKDMPAIRGRASYQKDKGIGHLDPGAVTMAYQIELLCDYILNNKIGK